MRYRSPALLLVALLAAFAMSTAHAENPAPGRVAPAPRDREPTAEERKIDDQAVQAQLDRKLPEINFNANQFADVIDFLRDVTGANLFVNWRALEKAGVPKDAPVTVRLRDVKFAKALDAILADVAGAKGKLAWVNDDGVITISTADDLAKNTVTRTYDIREILGAPDADPAVRAKRIAAVIKIVTGSISPKTWRENGGETGMVKELAGQLIVTQTEENQKAIANLFAGMHDLHEAGTVKP